MAEHADEGHWLWTRRYSVPSMIYPGNWGWSVTPHGRTVSKSLLFQVFLPILGSVGDHSEGKTCPIMVLGAGSVFKIQVCTLDTGCINVTARRKCQNCVFFHRGSPCRLDLVFLLWAQWELTVPQLKSTHSMTYLAQCMCLTKERVNEKKDRSIRRKSPIVSLHTAQRVKARILGAKKIEIVIFAGLKARMNIILMHFQSCWSALCSGKGWSSVQALTYSHSMHSFIRSSYSTWFTDREQAWGVKWVTDVNS